MTLAFLFDKILMKSRGSRTNRSRLRYVSYRDTYFRTYYTIGYGRNGYYYYRSSPYGGWWWIMLICFLGAGMIIFSLCVCRLARRTGKSYPETCFFMVSCCYCICCPRLYDRIKERIASTRIT